MRSRLGRATGMPQNLYNLIDAHRPLLRDMYKQLRSDFPYADIVAMGYPSPVGTGGALNLECIAITQAESDFILMATMRLNSRISEAAKDAGVWGAWVKCSQARSCSMERATRSDGSTTLKPPRRMVSTQTLVATARTEV